MQANIYNPNQPLMLVRKPTSITVFGVLCIVFGSIGFISILPDSAFSNGDVSNNPFLELMEENKSFANFMEITSGLSIISSIAMILIGIGLLRLYPLARQAAVIYGFYSIIISVLIILTSFVLIFARLNSHYDSFLILFIVLFLFISILSLIFPVLLIVFMRKPNVIEAFRLGPNYFHQIQQYMLNQAYNSYQPNMPYNYPQKPQQNQQFYQQYPPYMQNPGSQQYPPYLQYPPYPPYSNVPCYPVESKKSAKQKSDEFGSTGRNQLNPEQTESSENRQKPDENNVTK